MQRDEFFMLLQLFSIFDALGVATTDFSSREYLYVFYRNHNCPASVCGSPFGHGKGQVEER